MNAPEWLHPEVLGGTILYAVIGVVVLWLAFVIIDKITPYHLWDQIVREKNVALAIVVGATFIALGMIIAAAIHG
jgi:putative membrane protein